MEKAKAEAADAFRKVRRVAVAVFIIISPLLVIGQWLVVIGQWSLVTGDGRSRSRSEHG